jgi:outer membrane lipoprotein-sorting protein
MRNTIIVIAGLVCAIAAKADYVIKQTIENAGKTREVEMKIKDTMLRINTTNQNSAILDSKTGEETILLHQQKSFMKISGEQLKSRVEAMKRVLNLNDENRANIELKPTGKKETIQGYEAEEYTTTIGGVPTTIFVAKTYPNYQKVLQALNTAHKASALQSSLSIPLDKYPGMPLRTEIELKGQKLTTTLNSAEEVSLPDNEFAVPADYKEISPSQLQEK